MIDAWETTLAQAQALLEQGFMPQITRADFDLLQAAKDWYTEVGRADTFADHYRRLSLILQQILAFVLDTDQSAIGQIRDPTTRRHFLAEIDWSAEHFPRPGEVNEAEALFDIMAGLAPERRATLLPHHNVEQDVVHVPGEEAQRLYPEAAAAYVRLRAAAAADAIVLSILSAFRTEAEQRQIRRQRAKPNVAMRQTSAHTYGLAIDLRLSTAGLPVAEATIDPVVNVITMYRSPVYKWLFVNGSSFGWFPYRREPWHWEYNPPGLAERYPAEARIQPGTVSERATVAEGITALKEAIRSLTDIAEDIPPPDRYGGYTLQRGDRDDTSRYGGQVRSAAAGDNLPPTETTPYVTQLQRDLREMGFRIVGPDSGAFDRATEWAVREFQIYSKMPNVAQEAPPGAGSTRYVDRLTQVANARPYSCPVSGMTNADTRAAITQWLTSRWRCPVVVEAWNMTHGARAGLQAENIWLHDDEPSPQPRMFARDFSGYYTLPPARNPADLVVLGDHVTYIRWDGPRSVPPQHTWPEAELLPEHLVGTPLAALTASQRSTFKVIRAVSEVECIGFFDSVNAYDNAFVSLGPCHWTLGVVDGAVQQGELCGYLSYLRHADRGAFTRAVEFFGVKIDEDWEDPAGIPNGQSLFDPGSRKYTGWMALQQEGGGFVRMPLTEADGNYFKTWHWFYRFLMAGRTIGGFRRRMWHMARVRLRDIRATPWGPGVAAVPDGQGGTRAATIGDIYTSERALAMILRWHIRFPAHIASGGQAGNLLRHAFGRAAIPPTAGDPSSWGDTHETQLIQGLRDEVTATHNTEFINTINYVDRWPLWAGDGNPRGYTLDPTVGNLMTTRGSFLFDDGDLPSTPQTPPQPGQAPTETVPAEAGTGPVSVSVTGQTGGFPGSEEGGVASSTPGNAHVIVQTFGQSSSTGPWIHLSRPNVANRLEKIVNNPDLINQAQLNLCGPAVFLREWGKRDPVGMARLGVDLFNNGQAFIGNRSIKPGVDLIRQKYDGLVNQYGIVALDPTDPCLKPPTGKMPESADWMLMSSLRDAENVIFDYEGTPDEDLSAITMPSTVTGWLEASGAYSTVKNDTNVWFTKGKDHGLALQPGENADVILFINSQMLPNGTVPLLFSFTPNHYIALNEPLKEIGNDQISFVYWSWGSVCRWTGSINSFERNYYGSITATR